MTAIAFNAALFRAMFTPAFDDATKYPDALLQVYWDNATAYISDELGGCCCNGLSVAQQTLALNDMTAHLATLQTMISAGQTPGIEVSATIDKVSVSMKPPPAASQWQWWLNLTPYGAALLALLQVAAAGGFYFSGGGFSPKLQFRQ